MKKFILGLLAVTTIATANAQKNTILLYGTLGVNTENIDYGPTGATDNWVSWNVSPGIGYQFSHHFTVGVQGSFGSRMAETTMVLASRDSVYKTTYNDWTVGAFGRYTHYFGNTFFMFHQLDVSYQSGNIKHKITSAVTNSSEDTYNGMSAMLTPAVGVNIYKGFALNFAFGGIGFSTMQWDLSKVTDTKFNFTFGQQFNFGITKNFNCSGHRHPHEPGMHMRKMKRYKADEDEDEDE